jgi:hypothetical protein
MKGLTAAATGFFCRFFCFFLRFLGFLGFAGHGTLLF